MESFYTTGTQKKNDAYGVDGYCGHFNTVFEAMGWFYHYRPCQEARLFPTEEETKGEKRKPDKLRKQYIPENGFSSLEIYKCDWRKKCTGQVRFSSSTFLNL